MLVVTAVSAQQERDVDHIWVREISLTNFFVNSLHHSVRFNVTIWSCIDLIKDARSGEDLSNMAVDRYLCE